ncbi:hypothetical protein [Methanoregula sp.]|uniref:hypothetical protein n=1 Tax=Methanoregula sp. TaxID=2052170 RepID=UPI002CD209F2|nr:hypothetical protein [Methanoregula sp.]HVP96761.1 hypothetical protein [Methanoregula sp.]
MEPAQAKGYLLEYEILRLLGDAGYIKVKKGIVRGRGANHQIDAYGVFLFPTAFIYPIRLLSEVKFYDETIGLEVVRNFVGVLKDIQENYIVNRFHQRNLQLRYTEAGCIFSATPFKQTAQEYAWAHNIFLVSFNQIQMMDQLIQKINLCVQYPGIVAILNSEEKHKQKRIIDVYKKIRLDSTNIEVPSLVVGILDNVYPVILVGKKGWINRIIPPTYSDKLDSRKDYRQDVPDFLNNSNENRTPLVHIFHITLQKEPIEFSIPEFAGRKIIEKIKRKKEIIAVLQIPFLDTTSGKSVRRIISLDVKMPI